MPILLSKRRYNTDKKGSFLNLGFAYGDEQFQTLLTRLPIKYVTFESTIWEKNLWFIEFVIICPFALHFCEIKQEVGYAEVKYERMY